MPSPRILLTGGSGFLGSAIIRELLEPNPALEFSRLIVLDIKDPQVIDNRFEFVRGDICDKEKMMEITKDIDLVIHSAAIVDWGSKPEEEIYRVNVKGTEILLNAARENGVKAFVYTSSLDAIFGGTPLVDIDETIPYPDKQPNSYCRSKQMSEKLILATNGGLMKTCILRPSDIYGEADPFHIGSLISMAKGGFYIRLGDCTSKSQHVYVGNMANAHLVAAKALLEGNPAVNGSIYFITDCAPSNFFHFFDKIVEGAGYRIWPRKFNIPRRIAYAMGAASDGIAFMMRPVKKYTPKFSRFAVIYTCSDFTFKTDKAFRDFGFVPKYDQNEAFERTVRYFSIRRGNENLKI